ncbi:hypothetical protein F2Q70_00044098 [Brassica cretica]|uniref:Uncharacterized protein n=1 Tax=Brassica cretica TaxID=69181 RepID=A0A8S9KFU2_BRACR|nr:hypothetical protein F2Q70_00044098 [Brassica cretica]
MGHGRSRTFQSSYFCLLQRCCWRSSSGLQHQQTENNFRALVDGLMSCIHTLTRTL